MMGRDRELRSLATLRDENYATERNHGGRAGPSAAWGRRWSFLYVKENFLGPRPKVALTRKCPVLNQFPFSCYTPPLCFRPFEPHPA